MDEVDIRVPLYWNGTFEPKIIGKYSRNTDGMEEKILALYSCGMSQLGYHEADQRVVRCGDFPGAGDKNHGEDHAGGDRLAEPASRFGVSLCLYGHHPLQR